MRLFRPQRLMALLPVLLCACAHTPPDDPADPLERYNRVVYGFNEKLDGYIAQPVARGYVAVLPEEIRQGVSNFFDNVTYPTVVINDLLQGKFAQGARDTGRFLFNTTVGLGGILDPATRIGLDANDEDFGQTLGAWGVGPGWFLMLPVLGPSSNRDFSGQLLNGTTNPLTYTDHQYRYPLYALEAVNSRANLLGIESVLAQQFDRYAFVRGAYLQRRLSLVYDGEPPLEALYGDVEEE